MGVIGNIKEVATLLQKADNIELYRKILNIQASFEKDKSNDKQPVISINYR